ncbi:hypothetical protein ACQP04_32765 [Pseudonocardia halophobica]|uniref:hypothetical protein n=1 Tax=Pseudonocardia halophobica TaxID=29401 RepID=UPI003D92C1A4
MSLSPSQDQHTDSTPPSGSPDVEAPQSGTRRRLSTPSIVYGGLVVLAVLIVVLAGAASYDTALGGSTPAPELEVDTITETGHIR